MPKQVKERDDKAMIQTPDLWPRWPWLPIKRHIPKNPFECGLLCSTEEHSKGKMVVFFANLFHLPIEPEEFKKIPTKEYPNVDALLADGWVVD